MCFLNKLSFTGHLQEDDHKNFDCVRNVLVTEIEDVNSVKLINTLGIVDDLHVIFMTGEVYQIFVKSKTLRENIFQLIEERNGR